jgi:hypothetical protein
MLKLMTLRFVLLAGQALAQQVMTGDDNLKCLLSAGLRCKTRWFCGWRPTEKFLAGLRPALPFGELRTCIGSTRPMQRRRSASGCEGRSAAEELDEPSQVLRGRGE